MHAALLLTLSGLLLPTTEEPTAEALLKGLAVALEARPAVEHVVVSGSLELAWDGGARGVVGSFREERRGVDSLLENQLEAYGWVEEGRIGATTWLRIDGHVTLPTGKHREIALATHSLAHWRGYDDHYVETRLVGSADIDGSPVWLLSRTLAGARPEAWYLDQDTLLPRRIERTMYVPGGEWCTARVDFEEWHASAAGPLPKRRVFLASNSTSDSTITVTQTVRAVEVPEPAGPGLVVPAEVEAEIAAGLATPTEPSPSVLTLEPQPVALVRVEIPLAEVGQALAVILPEISIHLNEVGHSTTGAPYTRYHAVNGGQVDLEVGIPVTRPIAAKGRIQPGTLPGGRAVMLWHLGPYHELQGTHARLRAWMATEGHAAAGGAWEVYWTDPGLEPDPQKWRTQILCPLK